MTTDVDGPPANRLPAATPHRVTVAPVRRTVLCVSASMGAGHDGVARELAHRLRATGHDVEIRDFLDALPWALGRLLRRTYELEIRHAGWTYGLLYRFFCVFPSATAPLAHLISLLARRRLSRWVAASGCDLVVSVYPLSSQALGVMRRNGRLRVPAVTVLTDFAVHPLWVHRCIDLHLAPHPRAAHEAQRRTGAQAWAPGPVVSARFNTPPDRAAARAALGIAEHDRTALIVAGSWGVGRVTKTFRTLARSGRVVPIAVCGRDLRLQRRLRRLGSGVVVGWTNDMTSMLAAADTMIENAGGLTSMEAFVAGVPVVSYRPIPGHGRANTRAMHEAGVSTLVRTPSELLATLEALSRPTASRARQVREARAMMVGDASRDIAALLSEPRPSPQLRPLRTPRYRTRFAALAASLLVVPIAIDAGAGVAAAYGVGVAHPTARSMGVVYLAVRLDTPQLRDADVLKDLQHLNATAVVSGATIEQSPSLLRSLAARKIDLANGGSGRRFDAPWRHATQDVIHDGRLLRTASGATDDVFVPSRRIDIFDLMRSHQSHTVVVIPNTVISADRPVRLVKGGRSYVLDGTNETTAEVRAALVQLDAALAAAHLRGEPIGILQ